MKKVLILPGDGIGPEVTSAAEVVLQALIKKHICIYDMAKFELRLPKMGESVAEATITSWLKEVGDTIEEDEAILEIATDKVDSEIPSPVDGVVTKILFPEDSLVPVGEVLAIISMDGEDDEDDSELDDPEIKLDLARAYLSLGDKEASRSMLEEVLKSGNETQREEARQMMEEL